MSKLVFAFSFSFFVLTSLFATRAKKEQIPMWVQDPSFTYSTEEYLSNLGQGKSQKHAETDALEGLAAIFNRSIASNTQTSLSYSSKQSGGNTQVGKSKNIMQDVKISTNIKDLVGVEIRERWKSQDGTFYALAVIKKGKGAALYREKVYNCIGDIDKLLDSNAKSDKPFSRYFRYLEAFEKAQSLQIYKGCLAVLDSSISNENVWSNDEKYSPAYLKIKADTIAKAIEIFVDVSSEAKKLSSHVEKVLSKYGFTLSKNSAARYKLTVQLDFDEPLQLSGGRLAMRYNLIIELFDTFQCETVLPFAFEGKETQFDEASLKTKIFKALEKKAINEFAFAFNSFVSR